MSKRLKAEHLSIDELELDEEYIPRFFKKDQIKGKKRKLTKKQWLLLHQQEEDLKIIDIEQDGCDFKKQ